METPPQDLPDAIVQARIEVLSHEINCTIGFKDVMECVHVP